MKRIYPHRVRNSPMPRLFAQIAKDSTLKELRLQFGKSGDVIKRWCREAGVEPLTRHQLFAREPARRVGGYSLADRAVDECLRRYGPVFRCDVRGKPLSDGFFWNRGGRVLTDDDVIERAEGLGWDRNAWRRAA